MNGPFVTAVTKAQEAGSLWEFQYYRGGGDYDPRRQAVYLHSRGIALGPEWKEWLRCCMQERGELPRVWE